MFHLVSQLAGLGESNV